MKYSHLSDDERYQIAAMRLQHFSLRAIARNLGRSPSTISREIRRNAYPTDGGYRALHACSMARGRRRRARWGTQFGPDAWKRVEELVRQDFSPEQVSGHLRRTKELSISHETIYRHVWEDKRTGGALYTHLRGSPKKRRKRYGHYDSRGRLAGKRPISSRPSAAENRSRIGHWEIDTVLGRGKPCILTIVERKSGLVHIAKLRARTKEEVMRAMKMLAQRHRNVFRTITADNGCEFHGYREIEEEISTCFYFAAPHHSWERGTNENTNGLIRQYLPKRESMEALTQRQCDRIADKLNQRPRKRHGYYSPQQVFSIR